MSAQSLDAAHKMIALNTERSGQLSMTEAVMIVRVAYGGVVTSMNVWRAARAGLDALFDKARQDSPDGVAAAIDRAIGSPEAKATYPANLYGAGATHGGQWTNDARRREAVGDTRKR